MFSTKITAILHRIRR